MQSRYFIRPFKLQYPPFLLLISLKTRLSDNHRWSRLRCYYVLFMQQVSPGGAAGLPVMHTVACSSVMCSQDLIQTHKMGDKKGDDIHTVPGLVWQNFSSINNLKSCSHPLHQIQHGENQCLKCRTA